MKTMDEKKKRTEIIECLKPFVNGGVAGLLSCSINGALDYSIYTLNDARYRKHPQYALHCINVKMIPGMVLIDAFAYSQILGFYEILRRKAIARNDGVQPSLYQEAACGLIAGAAGAYLSFPFLLAYQRKQVESMGPIAERWRHRNSKWSDVGKLLRNGGPWLKRRAGLGMGMVATYNPSLHYLMESRGFSEKEAKFGAEAISAFSGVACAQLGRHASSFNSVRQTVKSKGPLGLIFAGFSNVWFHHAPRVVLFWTFLRSSPEIFPTIN